MRDLLASDGAGAGAETLRRLDILVSSPVFVFVVLALALALDDESPRLLFVRPVIARPTLSGGGGGDARFSYSTRRLLELRWGFLASFSWISLWLVAWSYPIRFIK